MSDNTDKVKLTLNQVKLTSKTGFDTNVYDTTDKTNYNKFIQEEDDIELEEHIIKPTQRKNVQKEIMEEDYKSGQHEDELFKRTKERTIANRESEYNQRKRLRETSPDRYDPLKDFDRNPEPNARTYSQIMQERMRENERQEILRKQIADKKITSGAATKRPRLDDSLSHKSDTTKLTDWDKLSEESNKTANNIEMTATPRRKRWDLTPQEATPRGNFIYKLIVINYIAFRTFVNI
jgi:splicing factor 3B subunit 1